MQNTFGRPAGLRNTFYRTPEEAAQAAEVAAEARVSDMNSLERGLRQGLHTTPAMLADAGSVYTEPVAPGLSNSLRNWATDQYRAAQDIPIPVSTWEEVEQNPLKIGSYAAGKLGQNLPQWGLVAPAAAVGAVSAGALGLGAAGAAAGSALGAYGVNVGMTSGEQARNFFEDPAIMANTTPEQRAAEALKYGAVAGALDTVGDAVFGSRLLGAGQALKAGVMPAVKHLAKTIPEAAVTEGLPELGQTALSQAQLGQLNPNRDTGGDASELKEAFFGGWAGGTGLTGAGRSVQVARANAEPVKEWLGETASSARNKLADMLRPSSLPPELNNASDEEILAWDAQQKQQKQQVAEQLATEALNDPSSSQTLKQKAAQFFEDVRNGVTDAWQEFSKGVGAERAVQRAQDGFDRFSEALRDKFGQRPGAASGAASIELSADDQAIFGVLRESLPAEFSQRGDPLSLYQTLREALVSGDPDLPWNALVDTFGGEQRAATALTRMHEGLSRMGEVEADPEFGSKVSTLLKISNERDNTEHGRFVATLLPRHGNVDKQTALKTISDIKRGLRSYSDMTPDMRRQFDTRMTELFGDRANDYLNSLVTNDTRLDLDGETEVDDDIGVVDGNQDPALQSIRETDGPTIRYVGSAQKRVDEGAKGSKQHGGFFNLAHPNEEVRGNIKRRMQAAKAEAKQRGMSVRELTPLEYARSAGINPNVIAEELGVKVEDLGKHPARILRVEDAPPGVLRDDPIDMNTEELNKLGATQTQKVLRPRASVDQNVAQQVREALAKPPEGGERFKALNALGYPHAVAVESVGGKNFVQMDLNYGGAGRFTVVKKDGTRLTMSAQDLISRQRKATKGQDPQAGPQGAADLQRQFASALSSILSNADVQGIEVRNAFGKVVTKQDDVMGAFGPFFQLMSTRDGGKVTLGQSNRKQVRGDKGRDAEKEFAGLDDEIAALEAELEDLNAELDTAGAKQARAIERRIEEVQSDLNELLEQKGDGYQNALAGEDTERAATTFEIAEGQALQEAKSPKARRFDEQTGEPLAQPANVGANAGKRGKLQSDIKSLEAEIKTLANAKGVPAQNRRAKLQAELDAKRAELEALGGAVKPASKPAPVRPAPKSDPKDIDADIEEASRASRERDYSEYEDQQSEDRQQVESTVDEVVSEATEQAQEQGAKKSELDELTAALRELKKALVDAYGRTADAVTSAVATKALPARETVDAMVEALRTALRQFIEAAKVTGQKANDLRKLVQKKIAEAQRVRSEIETQRRVIEKIMSDARARIADRVARGDLGDPKALSDKEVSEWNEPEARGSMITSLRNVTPEEAIAFEELLRAVEPLGLPTAFNGFLLAGEGSTSGAAVNAPNKTLILSKRLYDALTKAGDNQAAKDRVVYRMAVHELVHMVDANGSRKVFGTPIKGATFTSTGNPRLQPKGDLYQEAQRLTRWPSTSAYFAYPLQYNLDDSIVPSELVAQALSAYYTNPAALLKDSPLFYDFAKEIADGLVGQDRARVLQALSGVQSDGGNTPGGGASPDAGSRQGAAAGAAAGRSQRKGQQQAGGTRQAARKPSRHRSANLLKKLQSLVETAQNTLIDSDNKALAALGRVFSNETGSKDKNISFMSARVQKTNEHLNQLVAALAGHEKITLNAAVKGLQTGSLSAPGTQVREVQDKVRKVLDDLFDYMVDAGVDVKKRKDYFPRTWNPLAIQDNMVEFLDQLMQDYQQVKGKRMDPKSAQAIADVLILNRGAEPIAESDYHVGYTPYMMSTNARKLDYLVSDYSRFQRSDMVDILSTYISQAVHRAEYARRFGNDGEILRAMLKDAYAEEIHRATGSTAAWDAAVKQAEQDEATLAKKEKRQPNPDNVTIDKIKAYLTGAQDAVSQADEVIGRARKAVMAMEGTLGAQAEGKFKELLRQYTPAIIVYQNFRLLWLSLFSQFIDPLGVMVRGGTAKEAFNAYVRGLRGVMHGWRGTEAEDSATQLARKLGVIDAANALNTMGNMYSATYIDGRAKKINDALFRWNGVEQFSQGVRVGATEAAISFIKFHLDKGNRHSERYLAELGLKKGDKFDIDNPKIRDAIFRWVDGATVRPNAALRPVWASDPHYALFFHMKQFTYAFHKVILERMITEAKHGNFDPAYVGLAAYVPVMIAADVVRGFVGNGGDEPPWMRRADAGDIVMRGIERAGLLGIPQLGKDMIDWGPVEAAGPAIEHAAETVANLAGGEFNKAWRDALPAVNVLKDALDFK